MQTELGGKRGQVLSRAGGSDADQRRTALSPRGSRLKRLTRAECIG